MHFRTYTICTRRTTFFNLIECKSRIYKLNSRMKKFGTLMSKSIMPERYLIKTNRSLKESGTCDVEEVVELEECKEDGSGIG